MAVRSIIYDEGNPNSYESVEVHIVGVERKTFSSGDFVKDWYDATKWWIHSHYNGDEILVDSSSCDHFISDGAMYDIGYLDLVKIKGKNEMRYTFIEDGVRFFVEKGTQPTWDEFKNMYNDSSI